MTEPPWGLIGQEAVIHRLQHALDGGRLPHALLLAGPRGLGKGTAARAMAEGLLCARGPSSAPCGDCAPCRHRKAGTAPDFIAIAAEPGEEIRIDTIRDHLSELHLTVQESPVRVVLIEPAEALNPYAANALLKALEEPSSTTVFLLVSHRPGRVLATIRSRCQIFSFSPVPPNTLGPWLKQATEDGEERAGLAARLADGSPGRARTLLERDVLAERDAVLEGLEAAHRGGGESWLEVANTWTKAEADAWQPYLRAWLRDLGRVTVSAGRIPDHHLINADAAGRIRAHAKDLQLRDLEGLWEEAGVLERATTGSENTRLAAEAFLLSWRRAGATSPHPA